MIDTEDHERHAVRGTLAILAGTLADREFIRADRVLGPEITGAQSVDPAEQARHLVGGEPRYPRLALQRLVEGRSDIAAHGVVTGHWLVGALEDDHVLLAGKRLDDGGLGERTEDVQMNRT